MSIPHEEIPEIPTLDLASFVVDRPRVAAFDAHHIGELAEQINQFIDDHPDISVVDIKFAASSYGDGGGTSTWHSALVLYTEDAADTESEATA